MKTKLQLLVETRITTLKHNYIYLALLYYNYNTGISDKNCNYENKITITCRDKNYNFKTKLYLLGD